MRPTWILRGKTWRAFHLLRCDRCYKRKPGAAGQTSRQITCFAPSKSAAAVTWKRNYPWPAV
jgi:hypothetical protein